MVSRFMRYSGRAKKMPTRTRHIEDPNGSATTPLRPSLRKLAGMPSTVSEPNQVANTVAVTMYIGSERPASAKSFES
jgi:hypothetical protein